MHKSEGTITCVGCGARVPDSDGPTHRYVGAAAGCWAMLGEVQVRGYEDARFNLGQLGVDAYMAQHPGVPSPQSIQSVTVHLISLCLQLDQGVGAEASRAAMAAAERYKQEFTWLTPPTSVATITILDVRDAADPERFPALVRQWADAVWKAWSPHHAAIRGWVMRLGYT